MKNHMKGQLMEQGINFGMAVLFVGILLGAGAIALNSMSPSLGASDTAAQNASNIRTQTSLGNASNGLGNFSAQLPTVGTVAGVALIIVVLFLALGGFIMTRQS